MTVLHLGPSGNKCGIATYTNNLVGNFSSQSVHNRWTIPPPTELSRLTKPEVIDLFNKFIIDSKNYDVIHLQSEYGLYNGPGTTSFGLSVLYKILQGLKKLNKKVFVTFHSEPVFLKALGLFNFENRKCRRIWRKIAKLFTKENNITAICHTDVSRNKFTRSGFNNVTVITHGVIERKFNKKKTLKKRNKSVVLSIFGFIAHYKGHEFALAILDLLPKHFKLSIIGGRHPNSDGDEVGNLLKKAADMGLSDRVLVSGWASPEEADYHQQNSDICLAPYQTRELSASGAVTWSLTSGRPVIASNINSFKDITKDHQAMLLCHPSDRLEWVWAIKKVTEDAAFRKSLIANAKKYCADNSWPKICERHMELYHE